jgi:cell division protein FtsL
MKKLSIVISAFVLTLALTSCSKTYNCHCIYKTNGKVTHEDDHKISEGKKEKSAAACNRMDSETVSTLNGVTYVNTAECELN